MDGEKSGGHQGGGPWGCGSCSVGAEFHLGTAKVSWRHWSVLPTPEVYTENAGSGELSHLVYHNFLKALMG